MLGTSSSLQGSTVPSAGAGAVTGAAAGAGGGEGEEQLGFHQVILALLLLALCVYLVNIVIRLFIRLYQEISPSSSSTKLVPIFCNEKVVVKEEVHSVKLINFESISWSNRLTFQLNEQEIVLTNPNPLELLATFIRDDVGLKGTKLGCEEGGCGACTVVLKKGSSTISVNSCMRPLCSNDGMVITTVEGIGSVHGLSKEQESIVEHNGTQCGYCTPGWVSNMKAFNDTYGSNPEAVSDRQIEQYFDGNICRCTGYKPILDAFKSEYPNCTHNCSTCPSKDDCLKEIEDIAGKSKCSSSSRKRASKKNVVINSKSMTNYTQLPLYFSNPANGTKWLRPIGLEQLLAVLRHFQGQNIQLVGGNTSIGVTKYFNNSAPYNSQDKYTIFVDINAVPELLVEIFDPNTATLQVGSAVTYTQLIELLKKYSTMSNVQEADGKIYHHSVFSVVANHLKLIANTQVRNAGTWAGNLGIYKRYPDFPSDVVVSFAGARVQLLISDYEGRQSRISMDEFLQEYNVDNYLILSMNINESPSISQQVATNNFVVAEDFKICLRKHNAHAQVNASFYYNVTQSPDGPTCLDSRIVFAGVSSQVFIARETQAALKGSRISQDTLQRALIALESDLSSAGLSSAYGNPTYRHSVMQSCLYRSLLRCYSKSQLPPALTSTIFPFEKPVSRGTEIYHVDDHTTPISTPVHKLEAKIQATGEAQYPSDIPVSSNGYSAALIFTSKCAVVLSSIDVSEALPVEGVVAVYTASDIPGANTVGCGKSLKLFLNIGDEVPCIGAPVGIVVAKSDAIANDAASLVKLSYTDIGKIPVTNIFEAIQQNSFYDLPETPWLNILKTGNPEEELKKAPRRVKGKILAGGQNHFYMEAQTAIASFVDGETYHITCGTQGPALYQSAIASVLNVSQNKVNINCPRTGGGFGGKITNGVTVSASAALAASKLGQTVRVFNTRTADMYMCGGRESFYFEYEIGFNDSGKILAVVYDIYVDAGVDPSDAIGGLYMAMMWADNAFYLPNYLARAKVCYTNTPARTSTRAPGVIQSCLAVGILFERIAKELNVSFDSVQSKNFIQDGLSTILGQVIENCTLQRAWDTLMSRSGYHARVSRISEYNAKNLWRKRGIAAYPVKYGIGWSGYNAGVQIGVIQADGTVTVTHSGIEIGQGINTKVAQTVAYELGIDLATIRVASSATEKIANGGVTGGSGTSEVICEAAIKACRVLNERLKPYRDANPDASWADVLKAVPYHVSLNAEGWFSPDANPNQQPFQYFIYGACVSEVEIDVLSGELNVLASELVYDCGRPLNQAVDIGQIEGGFVMGLGYLTSERVDFNDVGMLQSVGSWEYKPPLLQDIPSIFNITLLAKSPNKQGILRSKAVGEPPCVLSHSIYFAMKEAISAARADAGQTGYFDLDAPATIDIRQLACLVTSNRFVMPN